MTIHRMNELCNPMYMQLNGLPLTGLVQTLENQISRQYLRIDTIFPESQHKKDTIFPDRLVQRSIIFQTNDNV